MLIYRRTLGCVIAGLLAVMDVQEVTAVLSTSSEVHSLQFGPGSSYDIQIRQREITLHVWGNTALIRHQANSLLGPFTKDLLVLDGSNQDTVICINLEDNVKLRYAQHPDGSGLTLTFYRSGLIPSTEKKAATTLNPPPSWITGIAQVTLVEKEGALDDPDPNEILCLGSKVMYPVPLPEIPLDLGSWRPSRDWDVEKMDKALRETIALIDEGKYSDASRLCSQHAHIQKSDTPAKSPHQASKADESHGRPDSKHSDQASEPPAAPKAPDLHPAEPKQAVHPATPRARPTESSAPKAKSASHIEPNDARLMPGAKNAPHSGPADKKGLAATEANSGTHHEGLKTQADPKSSPRATSHDAPHDHATAPPHQATGVSDLPESAANESEWEQLLIEADLENALKGDTNQQLRALNRYRLANPQAAAVRVNNRIQYLIGRLLLSLQHYEKASEQFETILKRLPSPSKDRAELMLAVGWTAARRLDTDRALRALTEALPTLDASRQTTVALTIASVLANAGQYQRTLKVLSLLAQNAPDAPASAIFQVLEAESLYRTNQFRGAALRYEAIKKELRSKAPAVYSLRIGESLLMQGRYNEAKLYFVPATHRGDTVGSWLEGMQRLRSMQVKYQSAKTSDAKDALLPELRAIRFNYAIAPIPDEIALEEIKAKLRHGDVETALIQLKAFLKTYSGNSQRKTIVAKVWSQVQARALHDLQQKQIFRGLQLYEDAHSILRDEGVFDAATGYLIARSFLDLGLPAHAFEVLTAAIFSQGTRQAHSCDALVMLAESLRKQSRWQDAGEILKYASLRFTSAEDTTVMMRELAQLRADSGITREAMMLYRRLTTLEQDPVMKLAAWRRVLELNPTPKNCAAIEPDLIAATAALVRLPAGPAQVMGAELAYSAGECAFRAGRYRDAAIHFTTALARHPSHSASFFARYAIASSYLRTGRNKEAEILLAALANERPTDNLWIKLARDMIQQKQWQSALLSNQG